MEGLHGCDTVAPYATPEEIESLVRAFEDCALSRAEWTHAAHLTVALWYIARHPRQEATRRIRDGIQRLNRANGVATTKTSGYHETMTLVWIALVSAYLAAEDQLASIVDLANGLVATHGDTRLPLRHYSRELLMSEQARFGWIEPDLSPLPA